MRETEESIRDAQSRKDKSKAAPAEERSLLAKRSKGINIASWEYVFFPSLMDEADELRKQFSSRELLLHQRYQDR